MSFKPRILLRFFAVTIAGALPAGRGESKTIGTFMPSGDVADAPDGFIDMCVRDAVLCDVGAEPPVPLGRGRSSDARAPVPAAGANISDASFVAADCAAVAPVTAHTNEAATWQPTVYQASTASLKRASGSSSRPAAEAIRACGTRNSSDWHQVAVAPYAGLRQPYVAASVDMASEQAILYKKMVGRINLEVNHDIIQVSDIESVGVEERWQRPVPGPYPTGDCEDLAIEKRMRLIAAGFPSDRLFLVVAFRSSFGLHTVLIARLDDGDYVLDSLTSRVRLWSDVHYVWLRQQSIGNPRVWRRVGTPPRGEMVQTKSTVVAVAAS